MQNQLQKQTNQQIDNIYRDNLWDGANVETKILESKGKDIDYDQINEENVTYKRHTAPQYDQQSQNIISDDLEAKKSINAFNKISEVSEKGKFQLKRSRQAQISNRLVKIREEIYKLEKELNKEESDEQSEEKQQQHVYLKHLTQLKDRLQKMQESKGFQALAKNQKQLLQLITTKDSGESDVKNLNQNDLQKILSQLQQQKQESSAEENEKSELTLVLDKSKQDLGVLIRLHNLQKRLNFIQYVIGDWKPKRMDLLDASKLELIRRKTQILKEELKNLEQNKEEFKQIGHNKDQIDELHTQTSKVKETMENIPKIVERLEQKKKIHNMCAQVLIDIETLEKQQHHILNSSKENKQLLDYVKEGMDSNVEIIKENTAYLKQIKKSK